MRSAYEEKREEECNAPQDAQRDYDAQDSIEEYRGLCTEYALVEEQEAELYACQCGKLEELQRKLKLDSIVRIQTLPEKPQSIHLSINDDLGVGEPRWILSWPWCWR